MLSEHACVLKKFVNFDDTFWNGKDVEFVFSFYHENKQDLNEKQAFAV